MTIDLHGATDLVPRGGAMPGACRLMNENPDWGEVTEMQWPKNVGVCIKDKDGRVQEQNTYCRDICGDQLSVVCHKGCMLFRVIERGQPAFHDGMQVHRRQMIEGQPHDVLLIEDEEALVSILYPLKQKLKDEKNLLDQYDLSAREQEIGALIMEGKSNEHIARELNIALSTLKTHINNIYRKIPNDIALRLKQRSLRKK